MTNKHTEGPWVIEPDLNSILITDETGKQVIVGLDNIDECDKANAQSEQWARAVIAKARGKS